MVFAIATAAALYVASSVFNAKLKGETYSEYSRQRVFLQKGIERAIMNAMRLSYEEGMGISDSDMWYTYNTSSTSSERYSSTGSSGYTEAEKWAHDPEYIIELYAESLGGGQEIASLQASLDASDRTRQWTNINSWRLATVDASSATPASSRTLNSYIENNAVDLIPSEFLMTPGWRALRTDNSPNHDAPYKIETVDNADDEMDFVRINGSKFPSDLVQRKDLPFNQNSGWGRAVRLRYRYSLAPDDTDALGSGSTSAWTDPIWIAEEASSNYQLILLDKAEIAENNSWPTGGTKKIYLANSGSTGENVGQMLAVGAVDLAGERFGKKMVGTATTEHAPFMTLVDAGNYDIANATGIEVRHFPENGYLGFGAAIIPSGGVAPSPSESIKYTIPAGSDRNSKIALRRDEIRHAQALASTSVLISNAVGNSNPSIIEMLINIVSSIGNYRVYSGESPSNINPVLALSNIGGTPVAILSRQIRAKGVSFLAHVLGTEGALLFSKSALVAPISSTPKTLTLSGSNIHGISFYKSGSNVCAEIDLATLDLDSSIPPRDREDDFYPASSPREIHISGTSIYAFDRLVIKGSETPGALLNETPIKIVTDIPRIEFANTLNYRRFIIVSRSDSQVSLNFPSSASSTWYGALFGAGGVSFNGGASKAVHWYGSIVAAKQFSVFTDLYIYPDDGKDLDSGSYADEEALHNLLAPRFRHTDLLPFGRPVPLRAPSLLWIFK